MVDSLFGSTPGINAAEEAARDRIRRERLDAFQVASGGRGGRSAIGASIGALLGRGANRLFGGPSKQDRIEQSPEVQAAKDNIALLNKVKTTLSDEDLDLGTSEGLTRAGQIAFESGNLDLAANLAKRSREAKKTDVGIEGTEATTEKTKQETADAGSEKTGFLSIFNKLDKAGKAALINSNPEKVKEFLGENFLEEFGVQQEREERLRTSQERAINQLITKDIQKQDVQNVADIISGQDLKFDTDEDKFAFEVEVAAEVKQAQAEARAGKKSFNEAQAIKDAIAKVKNESFDEDKGFFGSGIGGGLKAKSVDEGEVLDLTQ